MITASVNFFENSMTADLTCREREIQDNLNKVGVITPISQIPLNNALTLQIHLYPNDEVGKMVYDIVDFDKDTLGNVQRLCRHIYCFNQQNAQRFVEMLENGTITSIAQGIATAQRLREKSALVR